MFLCSWYPVPPERAQQLGTLPLLHFGLCCLVGVAMGTSPAETPPQQTPPAQISTYSPWAGFELRAPSQPLPAIALLPCFAASLTTLEILSLMVSLVLLSITITSFFIYRCGGAALHPRAGPGHASG